LPLLQGSQGGRCLHFSLFCFLFLLLVALGLELRTLYLQSRCSAFEPLLQPVLLWLFWGWGGSHELFSPGWPQTSILPISASQVARITGVSH
jgi:hypothetical protein